MARMDTVDKDVFGGAQVSEPEEQAIKSAENKSLDERRFLFEQLQHAHSKQMDELKYSLQQKELLQKRSDPLLVVIIGGIIAALANAGVSYYTGTQQISLETTKHENNLVAEKYKAEATRISDATKSNDQIRNACQLDFLLKFELITNEKLKSSVNQFLRDRKGAEAYSPETVAPSDQSRREYTSICSISTTSSITADSDRITADNDKIKVDADTKTKSGSPPKTDPLPRLEKKLIKSLSYETDWIGGGHSQAEACNRAIATYKNQYSDKILEPGAASEQVRKDWIGRVTYKYSCTVNVYDMVP